MTPRERIINFLCHGVPTQQIADAVGCEPSYVSQIKADPEVQEIVASKLVAATEDDIKHDSIMDRAEHMALERLEKTLPFANFGQTLAAFKILNSAERRQAKSTAPAGGVVNNLTVNLTLPSAALPNYVRNSKNEIIEVEGKTMISATAKSLDAILAMRAQADAPKMLPQTTDLERAANMLDSLSAPQQQKRTARALPAGLSVDVL